MLSVCRQYLQVPIADIRRHASPVGKYTHIPNRTIDTHRDFPMLAVLIGTQVNVASRSGLGSKWGQRV